ncbi:MAG TPA: hypothetical protein VM166_10760 [Gemmatimonadaceae bacterium]|nr:hypothetical protein [Gemmatimonadaceae bacterium]
MILAVVCLACSTANDARMEADSAKAADAIKLRFARAKEAAARELAAREAVEKAAQDSAARIEAIRQDSIRESLGLPTMAQLAKMVPKVSPDSLRELPLRVRSSLSGRGCLIPVAFADAHKNAKRGEFSAKGQAEWALMCSVEGVSQILIVSAATGTVVDSLAVGGDAGGMEQENGKWWFTRSFIVYPASKLDAEERFGLPRPLDHDVIDVAQGMTSTAWYRVNGIWHSTVTAD